MKRALVLSGGGSRGAYQIGAAKALYEMGYRWDIITGASVGSLNGAMLAAGNMELAERMWSQITTERILRYTVTDDISTVAGQRLAMRKLVKRAITAGDIDQTPLKSLLLEVLDVDAVYASPVEFGLMTVRYPSMRPKALFLEDMQKEDFVDWLLASSAFVPAMKPVTVGAERYIDGGFYDNLPTNMAIDRGAQEIVEIFLDAVGVYRGVKDSAVKVTRIAPRGDMGSVMLFDPEFSRRTMRRGYLDAMKTFGKYDGWSYTFEKGAFGSEHQRFLEFTDEIAGRAFPSTAVGMSERRHAEMTLLRALVRATDARTVAGSWLSAAADVTGGIFGVEREEIYDAASFNAELARKVAESRKLHIVNPFADTRGRARRMAGRICDLRRGKPAELSARMAFLQNLSAGVAALYCAYYGIVR